MLTEGNEEGASGYRGSVDEELECRAEGIKWGHDSVQEGWAACMA